MSNPSLENPTISYATPARRSFARPLAAGAVLFAGVAPAVVGGCFLIGVMMIIEHMNFTGFAQPMPMTRMEIAFVIVLLVLALLSFTGAGALIFFGARSLLRFLHS